jgi:enoyl-CoA hydratase/carnithine racemase
MIELRRDADVHRITLCGGENRIELVAWLGSAPPEEQQRFAQGAMALMGRLATAPIPTVAALNGHCYAAGALLAMACDYRVMREDRGWICFPEVDVSVPIPPLAMALLRSKLPPATLRDVVLSGRRYAAAEAVAAGLVDAVAPADALQERADELARSLAAKPRASFAGLKRALYADLRRLIEPAAERGAG